VVLLVCEGLDGREWANESLQNSAELNVFENSLPNTFLTKKQQKIVFCFQTQKEKPVCELLRFSCQRPWTTQNSATTNS
jgi:hypothetical protein